MGGYGSGRTGGHPTVESTCRLDVSHLLRMQVLRPGQRTRGTLCWLPPSDPRIIAYEADLVDLSDASLHLRGVGAAKALRGERIRLTVTRPRYGGQRWWFICPRTGCRARVLYRPRGTQMFASRLAYRLAYRSQRQTDVDRLIARARIVRQKLNDNEIDLLSTPECPKPKGMHWSTYCRLTEEADAFTQALQACAPPGCAGKDRCGVTYE